MDETWFPPREFAQWRMRTLNRVLATLLLLACAGCSETSSDDDALPTAAPECNPIASELDCLLPYPSNVFLIRDDSLPSGRRVELPETVRPRDNDGIALDLAALYPWDGFSPGTQILALLGTKVDRTNLPTYDPQRPETQLASLDANNPTVLLDTVTGERVLHIAEPDPRTTDDRHRALVIRPLARLVPQRRYIVALRQLRDENGTTIVAPAGFRAIRDETVDDPELQTLARRYERQIFPQLADGGVTRADLQLAWDFTVSSEEHLTHDMLAVRDDALARFAVAPPTITITSTTTNTTEHIARRVEGTVRVPLYTEQVDPPTRIRRDKNGEPIADGHVDVPFLALVPPSVLAGTTPARLVQYGHGFFGSRTEMETGYLMQLADDYGFVAIGCDWWGMSTSDLPVLVDDILNRPSIALRFTDRLHQAMANFLALGAARFALADEPALQQNGAAVFDPARLYFIGISNGHVLGGTFLTLSPDIERGVLGSGGANLSFMMMRSDAFGTFLDLIGAGFPDPLDQQKIVLMTQSNFDRVDPLTYAPHVRTELYPGAPAARRVLLQMGVGDAAVPNLGSELHARALGVPLLAPAVYDAPLLEQVTSTDDSALAIYGFEVSPFPGVLAIPPRMGNQVHEAARRLRAAQEQVSAFLRPEGRIESFCDGLCDPE